ncbi:putative NADH:ubiquinone oxidoreductase, subunit RnfB [Serratia symbiotica str. 'Cinara cedri']|nr:putative NADH:ubiquinone oxidoreductase, subunit RnfB [Serratia symbiotica str. 'Cinara cedri']
MKSLWIAITVLSTLGFLFGITLSYAAKYFAVAEDPLAEQIDAILPQSQCGQCGYPGCNPYARAVANGEIINKCAPGGEDVMLRLAELLNVEPRPLSNKIIANPIRHVAYINETYCIGCTKCIQCCPVDAIIGSTRAIHTVIADLCTGCNLCIMPCPTNCISMIPVTTNYTNRKRTTETIPIKIISMEKNA